uniref:Translocase of inner mitochondrial membrane 10 homolog B (yeast) n=1 Tax=Oryzias latipes TaxID=8090 RepID=A0A3P9KPH7_ORYLA
MDADQQLRNLKDFLLVYNRMTEICFQRCSSNFNYRNLTMDEERCVDNCAGKLIRTNHRLMSTYVHLMPRMVQRRMEELESKAAENAQATEGATVPAGVGPAEASQSQFSPSASTQVPPSAPEVASEIPNSILVPAKLDIPSEGTNTGVKLSAATPVTPNIETSHPQGFPQPTLEESQRDFGSRQASLSENLLSEASSVSKSEALADQKSSSQVSPLPGQQS